jgi:hypothetical protein
MSILNITEFAETIENGVQVMRANEAASQSVTISGTSAQSADIASTTAIIRLVADSACFVATGASPTATSSDMYLPANSVEYFTVAPGDTIKVAAVTA